MADVPAADHLHGIVDFDDEAPTVEAEAVEEPAAEPDASSE